MSSRTKIIYLKSTLRPKKYLFINNKMLAFVLLQ